VWREIFKEASVEYCKRLQLVDQIKATGHATTLTGALWRALVEILLGKVGGSKKSITLQIVPVKFNIGLHRD